MGDIITPGQIAQANEAYGRVREGIFLGTFALERAFPAVTRLLKSGDWRICGQGFHDIAVFMDSLGLDKFRSTADERKELVAAAKAAQETVSNRDIAKALGVGRSTIDRDIGPSGPPRSENANENNQPENASGPSGPPGLSGAETAKLAERRERRDAARADKAAPVPTPQGKYDVIVADLPWPMEKIDRDVRPNQAGFDYPTMDEDELFAFGEIVETIAANDCHLFLWTTQRFLPLALKLVDAWGFRYVLQMVWRKSGGYQPVGLPQFNCEFVIYGRRGSPQFVDTKAFPTCFDGARREHSRKPAEFYDMICRVTSGRRIDVFSREPRSGFDQFGDEADKFTHRPPPNENGPPQ